jgi:hypothetical protein
VARNHLDFVWEREQARLNGVDNLGRVASGQICASDAAGEERVTRDNEFERREVEAN